MGVLDKLLRVGEGRKIKALQGLVPDINAHEPEMQKLSDDALKAKTGEFRERLERTLPLYRATRAAGSLRWLETRKARKLLAASPMPLSLDDIGRRFTARGPWKKRLPQLLDMLTALGRASEDGGRYRAR